jgi:hypothetical protein
MGKVRQPLIRIDQHLLIQRGRIRRQFLAQGVDDRAAAGHGGFLPVVLGP